MKAPKLARSYVKINTHVNCNPGHVRQETDNRTSSTKRAVFNVNSDSEEEIGCHHGANQPNVRLYYLILSRYPVEVYCYHSDMRSQKRFLVTMMTSEVVPMVQCHGNML